MPDLPDYYKLLDLPHTATQAEIKARYLLLAREFHPDNHQGDAAGEARLKEITAAKAVLSDPDRRRDYDRKWEVSFGRRSILHGVRVSTIRDRSTGIHRNPVTSTIFRSIGYDHTEQMLEIEFHTGTVIQYMDFPEFLFQEFMTTDKKGTFYRTHIIGKFRERCVK